MKKANTLAARIAAVRRRRAAWVKALRSGRYTQAHGALFKYDYETPPCAEPKPVAFCCLGVGCVVAGISKKAGERTYTPIRAAYGLSVDDTTELYSLNDGMSNSPDEQPERQDFVSIAGLIDHLPIHLDGEDVA